MLVVLAALVAALLLPAGAAPAPDAVVWLCRPGMTGDPCAANLSSTRFVNGHAASSAHPTPAPHSRFDCFYVYPTVSRELGANADLRVQRSERSAAIAQASRFSQVCNVWAPMYRQRTMTLLLFNQGGSTAALDTAFASLLSAWHDYLAHDNGGRPIVFIGHSQGANMLIRLLQHEVDNNAALRRRMVSAILLGGNVTVANGSNVGGSFAHIPACRAPAQTGCVIAYSTFDTPPPANSYFGIPGQGIETDVTQSQHPGAAVSVLCTNPAALGGGSAPLDTFLIPTKRVPAPAAIATPWAEFPGLYSARCEHQGNATWLQVTRASGIGEEPRISAPTPRWGLHLFDVNIALGNLLDDVRAQEAAYR